ncbi:hypothetical protein ACJMK2_031972 [Sinanodonta woodiana]|uniref:Uncharacterized protein n=1 Tax=Sinanodonta woodiana TaxID=1069815 RepID=A0ABD3X4A1_SINWO
MVDFRVNNMMFSDDIGKADGTSSLGQDDIDIMRIPQSSVADILIQLARRIQCCTSRLHMVTSWPYRVNALFMVQSLVMANIGLYVSSYEFNQGIMQQSVYVNSSTMQWQPMSSPSHPTLIYGGKSIMYLL